MKHRYGHQSHTLGTSFSSYARLSPQVGSVIATQALRKPNIRTPGPKTRSRFEASHMVEDFVSGKTIRGPIALKYVSIGAIIQQTPSPSGPTDKSELGRVQHRFTSAMLSNFAKSRQSYLFNQNEERIRYEQSAHIPKTMPSVCDRWRCQEVSKSIECYF
jgi:hypothetical protein